ncbi:MAG: hypothetical protein ACR2PF_03845, partial [Rhizobiaceae bacterium]
SNDHGTLYLGQGSMATDGISYSDFSGTAVAATVSVQEDVEEAFEGAWQSYDQCAKSSRSKSLIEWRKLSRSDRKKARARISAFKDQWIAEGCTLSMLIASQTYLADRRFDQIADPTALKGFKDNGEQPLTPHGKHWMVVRLAILLRGPIEISSNTLVYQRDRKRYPYVHQLDNGPLCVVTAKKAISKATLDKCVKVTVGSEEWKAWEEYHIARDWPFVTLPEGKDWLWFPAGHPKDWIHNKPEAPTDS